MLKFHYCDLFERKIEGQPFEELVKNRIIITKYDNIKHLNCLSIFNGSIYVLKTENPQTRTIIQQVNIEIDDDKLIVLFVRDILANRNLDYYYGKIVLPSLKKGDWLKNNPLPENDRIKFVEDYKKNKKVCEHIEKVTVPDNLSNWLTDFELDLSYEIFETEEWVKYALNDSEKEGMLDKYVNIFRLVFEEISNSENLGEIVKEHNDIKIRKYSNYNVGILYCNIYPNSKDKIIVIFNGAHIGNQKVYWDSSIKKIVDQSTPFDNNIENVSRYAFRAYPKWTIFNENLWFAIQKSNEMSNLSLTREQIDFLKKFKFPYYINGQAGSGKSTMLYYLFANIYIYKCLDEIKGNIIFLTENENLLEQTKKCVFDLLNNNAKLTGLTTEQKIDSKNCFNTLKDFLRNLIPENDRENFKEDKYLSFSKFKYLYEHSQLPKSIIKKYSAEESWFTIITYIYGYNSEKIILSKDYLTDEVKEKSRIIPIEKFEGIEKNVLKFYNNLINEEEYWDKLKIIRYIESNKIQKPEYSVVICDEAQDFSRVELRFILRLSEFLKYNLSDVKQVPIIFAGDPNQTVNPSGFRQAEITSMLFEELKEIGEFRYISEENIYNPIFNYRSSQSVVSLANFIQYYRVKNLGIRLLKPQEAKRPDLNSDRNFNTFLSYEAIEDNEILKQDLINILKYKIFIVPVDSQDKEDYQLSINLLSLIDNAEIKTSVEAKGAEYEQVVLFGFGEYFEKNIISLNNNKNGLDEQFQKRFFFNKLYVGITRAQTELLIIDSKSSEENFWKKLVNNNEITDDNWKLLNDFKDKTIEFGTDSIKHILISTPEDARKNAEKDKEQGEYDNNPARLKVAANQFFKLGFNDEGYTCLALSEQIKGNLKKAAELFLNPELKNTKLEEAATCLFKGGFFKELLDEIGINLRNTKQEVRIVISLLETGNSLMKQDVDVLYKNKDVLHQTIKNIDWRNELINLLISNSKSVIDIEQRKDLVEIFENIVTTEDYELWKVIGDIYYDLSNYEKAIRAWDYIDNYDYEKYIKAQIEYSKATEDFEKTVLWLGEFLNYIDNSKEEQIIYKNIIDIYNDNPQITIAVPKYYLFVYKAIVLFNPQNNIEIIGRKAESAFLNNQTAINSFYKELLKINYLDKKVVVYLIERWAKITWKIFHEEADILWRDKLNFEYMEYSKFYNISFIEFSLDELTNLPDHPQPILWNPPEHFSNLIINNFRQFSQIELKKLGQFNLIVGDNNVGKTSLLEALLFSTKKEEYLSNLAYSFEERINLARYIGENNQEHYHIPIAFIHDFIKKDASEKEVKFTLYKNRNIWNFTFRRLTVEEIQNINQIATGIDVDIFFGFISDKKIELIELPLLLKKLNPLESIKSPFIPFGKGFGKDLAKIYKENIDNKKQDRIRFIECMKTFIPNIERISPDTETGEIGIEENGFEEEAPLHQYGEGANKLFRILVQMTLQKGKRLLIDEIDSGIHYSHFINYWKVILKLAKEYDVQIFATTHNSECIKYFKDILIEEDYTTFQDDSRIITLRQLPDKNVKAYTRIFNEFQYEIDNDLDLRGGKL